MYTGLTSFTIPASLVSLENQAFYGCGKLQEVIIEENSSLKEIPPYCFSDCNKLSSFIIPEDSKLVTIDSEAFRNCPLTSFYVPKTLKSMINPNFNRDTMKDFTINPENTYIVNIDGLDLYYKQEL